jgi:hypothetical protein
MDNQDGPRAFTLGDFEPTDATADTSASGAAVFDDDLVSKYSQHATDRWAAITMPNGQVSSFDPPDDANGRNNDAADAAAAAFDAADAVAAR